MPKQKPIYTALKAAGVIGANVLVLYASQPTYATQNTFECVDYRDCRVDPDVARGVPVYSSSAAALNVTDFNDWFNTLVIARKPASAYYADPPKARLFRLT